MSTSEDDRPELVQRRRKALRHTRLVPITIFLVVLGIAVALVWFLLTSRDPTARELGKELGRLTAQLALITGVGAYLVQDYNRVQERKAAVNEFRKAILRSLIQSYTGVKRSRRLLRARCRVRVNPGEEGRRAGAEEIPRVVYDEQMGAINDVQLELEILVYDLKMFSEVFSETRTIRVYIENMGAYLDTLIAEYETALREADDSDCVPLDHRLGGLRDLIHGSKDGLFRKIFTRNFKSALSSIQAERLRIG